MTFSPIPALSQTSAVMFTHENIQILPVQPTPTRDGEAFIVRPTLTYDIEVRANDALRLEYIHTLNTLTDTTGVMIALDKPAIMALPYMKVATPVDALFVAANGRILQIIPGAVLGNVSQVATSNAPMKAFLFLKNGQSATRGIRPGDTLTGSMFSKQP